MKTLSIIFFTIVFLYPFSKIYASQKESISVSGQNISIYKADFWTGRLENPDEIILSPKQIEEMNNAILSANDEMANVSELGNSVSKQVLLDWMSKESLPHRKMFGSNGKAIKDSFYKKIIDNMNVETVTDSNQIVFGVISKKSDIRAFPTDTPVLKSPSARDFDSFQYSSIYPPQPVALLHKSKDGKWGYFQTPFVRGWIKTDNIVVAANREDVNENMSVLGEELNQKTLVITGSKVTVLRDKKINAIFENVPMGSTFVLQGEENNYWIVRFPKRDTNGYLVWTKAYIEKKSDAHIGYLAYTKLNVISEAFKMLGESYGWGGRNGLRDCSSFIKDVFSTIGINLPRNSRQQAASGQELLILDEPASPENIKKALDSAVPGITLLGLSGHIMLYLGNIDGSYYSLHQVFGYYVKDGFRTINKAVVTNLELGKDSKMGPIKNRIKSVNLLLPFAAHLINKDESLYAEFSDNKTIANGDH